MSQNIEMKKIYVNWENFKILRSFSYKNCHYNWKLTVFESINSIHKYLLNQKNHVKLLAERRRDLTIKSTTKMYLQLVKNSKFRRENKKNIESLSHVSVLKNLKSTVVHHSDL